MEKASKTIKGILLFLLSVTWCVLQTVIGAVLALVLLPQTRFQRYRGMIVAYHPYSFTFSLGTFAFVSEGAEHPRAVRGRLYGHYVQSLIFGPLFLFVDCLPQLVVRTPIIKRRRAERGVCPEDLFTDRQAARLQANVGE